MDQPFITGINVKMDYTVIPLDTKEVFLSGFMNYRLDSPFSNLHVTHSLNLDG